jgi:hypothetical protein
MEKRKLYGVPTGLVQHVLDGMCAGMPISLITDFLTIPA